MYITIKTTERDSEAVVRFFRNMGFSFTKRSHEFYDEYLHTASNSYKIYPLRDQEDWIGNLLTFSEAPVHIAMSGVGDVVKLLKNSEWYIAQENLDREYLVDWKEQQQLYCRLQMENLIHG